MLFGWAKPVPVNYHALRTPKRDMMWVAAAGPARQPGHGARLGAAARSSRSVLPRNYFTDPMFLISQAGVEVNSCSCCLT